MDKDTLQFYEKNSMKIAELYDSVSGGVSNYFNEAFENGMKILDMGCGSGRDLRILNEMGFDADGIDACDSFVEIANDKISKYGSKVFCDALPELSSVPDNSYHGVLCSAVLMHVPNEELFDAVFTIRRILKENGRLLLSIPMPDSTISERTMRDADNRLFNGIMPGELQLMFERIGFAMINSWTSDDSLNRQHRKWKTMLFELRNADGTRPIDTIESVLNKDKKVATYKLALFRALAELATTNYRLVVWQGDESVLLPVESVAEKWIEYYWPIFEADNFIPQIQAEAKGGKPIAFRMLLSDLIEASKQTGGLSGFTNFTINSRNNNLSASVGKLLKKLLSKLKTTIINGPIKHSGGIGDSTVFGYKNGNIIIPAGIWKELALMGHWIQDATILRWAELTHRISNRTIKPSEVIDCLLTIPVHERDVNAAKSFYDQLRGKECVWSGKQIADKYDLDHAIPFSLWKNNDLWNLLPADSKVNAEKKDRLPANSLIKSRKDCIIHYWTLISNEFPARFEHEASKLVGIQNFDENNWENKLFATFAEAVEITAIQRGINRWKPVSFAATGTEQLTTFQSSTSEPFAYYATNETEFSTVSLPYYSDLKVACGQFDEPDGDCYSSDTVKVEDIHGNLDTKRHFVVKASGDSMDGGNSPIKDGDLLLLELNTGGTISNQIFAVEYVDNFGNTSYVLKRIEKQPNGTYQLVSKNKNYEPIPVNPENMKPFARFIKVIRL